MSIYVVVRLRQAAPSKAKLMARLMNPEPRLALGVTSAVDKRIVYGVAAGAIFAAILGVRVSQTQAARRNLDAKLLLQFAVRSGFGRESMLTLLLTFLCFDSFLM